MTTASLRVVFTAPAKVNTALNKTPARLRDVHELFMDTGLGRDGYSIIGQGKIDSTRLRKMQADRGLDESGVRDAQ